MKSSIKPTQSQHMIQRDHLDQRFFKLRNTLMAMPRGGWVQAIRASLGMSAIQLAKKLGMSRQSIYSIEHNEVHGTVTVETLKRVAETLHCDLSVTFIPREPLRVILEKQALLVATRIVERTELHMRLEQQQTGSDFREKQIKEIADELLRNLDHRLWEEF